MSELRTRVRTCDECPYANAYHPACIHPRFGMPGRELDDYDQSPPKWCPLRKKPVTFRVVAPLPPKAKKTARDE